MKTKTQKILRTLVFLVAVLGLVACQGGEISISETNTPTPVTTFTDVPTPPSSTPKPPTPVPTLDPSVVLVPRYILPGAPYVAIGILGTVCNYQTDSWGERTAYIAYDCPDLDVIWLSVRFTTLEEGETAQDLFGELPPEGHMAIAPSDFLSHYDNLALSGRTENSEYSYFMVYETERFVISSEVFFTEDATMSLEEFYPENGETVLNAVLEIMLEKVMSGGTPPEPTPMAVGQQELHEQIRHWLVTELEANEFYLGASDMWGDPFDGTWVSLGDDVDAQRGSVCREFEDRTNADAPLVTFLNCVYDVGLDYDLDKILENRPNAVVLESAFDYPDHSIIYGRDLNNGHTSLNAFILQDDYLIYVFLESRTLAGQTPEDVFNEFNDGFIYNVLMTNLRRIDPITSTLTQTQTPTLTTTPTKTPTRTRTPSPTASPTKKPTSTKIVDLLPSNACAPGESLIYIEDFQDNEAAGWPEINNHAMGWELMPHPEKPEDIVARNNGDQSTSTYLEDSDFDNAVYRVWMMLQGRGSFFLMWDEASTTFEGGDWSIYQLYYNADNSIYSLFRYVAPSFHLEASHKYQPIEENVWHKYEVSYYEGRSEVWMDDALLFAYQDPHPLPSGRVGIEVRQTNDENFNIYFDDISICKLDAPFAPLPPP